MSQANRCNACGADLSSRASPEGYCPKCLLAFALDNGENGDPGFERDSADAISATQTAQTPSSDSPERIGPFRILQKLGEGGMGEVYLAEQTKPVRRRVALKLIKPGMDSKQVLARFESERQALALMDHPSIAKVFDGGTTEQGRPYFAMEYIEGEPITRYCDRHRLSTQERLGLFMRVCEGVQHAHQKGVIHRDIKPSNVLVNIQDQKPVPRIIDFGVAKATQQRLTERTVFTRLGVLIGTPEYMSPEQAEMTSLDVDTRTDVYSLGVLLYELLVGALPFDSERLRQASFDEIRRKIREDEPSKPSTKIRTLGDADSAEAAQHRGVDPTSLRKQLRGDLDWITMKALEKDRTRRYGSPAEFAADIARHLRDEPVVAGPPSVRYRARKFVRRHRFGSAVAVAGVSALAIFAAVMALQMSRVARERDRANREAEASERVSSFLANMLNSVDAERLGSTLVDDLWEHAKGGQVTTSEQAEQIAATLAPIEQNATDIARHLLDEEIFAPAAESIEEQLTDDPLIAARLRHTLGSVYYKLGLYEQSGPLLEQAFTTRRELLGEHDRRTLSSMSQLAWLRQQRDRREAETLFSQRLLILRRVRGNDDTATLNAIGDLANNYQLQRRYSEAEVMLREVLETKTKVYGADHASTAHTMFLLGAMYVNQDRNDDAEPLLRQVIDSAPAAARWRWVAMRSLAKVNTDRGRYTEAELLLEQVLDHHRRVLGASHPVTLQTMLALARTVYRDGQLDAAETLVGDAVERHRQAAGSDDPATLAMIGTVASVYYGMRDHERARPYLEELLEGRKKRAQEPDASADARGSYARVQTTLGNIYQLQGNYAEAEMLLREAIATNRDVFGSDHPRTAHSLLILGASYSNQRRYEEAESLLAEAVEIVSGEQGTWETTARRILGQVYLHQERYEEAESLLVELLKRRGTKHLGTLDFLEQFVTVYHEQGRYEDARPFVSELLSLQRQRAEAPDADADAKNLFAWYLLTYEPANARNVATALEFALEAARMSETKDGNILDTLALAYYRSGDTETAIKWGREALTLVPEGDKELRTEIEARLAEYETAAAKSVDAPNPHPE